MSQEKTAASISHEGKNIRLSIKINRRFLDFITPSMIMTVLLLAFLLVVLRERIGESYHENIPLNSAIFAVVGFAIFKAFRNNYILYKNIGFLESIEQLEERGDVSREDVQDLVTQVGRRTSLFNTQNMYKALENLSVYGHLNFSDNDSRLIKSKFGNRIKHERDIVSYFAGLLIMMGLIGTFWGLLETITAVGGALNQVAGGFSAEAGPAATAAASSSAGDDLGKFIGSISAPLQGMGIAFSASLFGIGGSLILGFLNFFSTHAQNHVIENVSRWIDNRIPQLNPALAEKVAGQVVPKSDDLKSWLAGFVYLSSQTNQKMGQIMLALSKSTQAMLKSAYQIEKVYTHQKESYMAIETMSTSMNTVKDSMKYITKNIEPTMNRSAYIHSNLEQIRDILSKDAATSSSIANQQIEQMAVLGNQLREFNTTFQAMSRIQGSLVIEIEKLQERSQHNDNLSEFTNLVWQLNTILEEIKQKNVSAYMNIFDTHEGTPAKAEK